MDEAARAGWVKFLAARRYDCFFTMTFQSAARSSDAALHRAEMFLTRYFSGRREKVSAFIVAEPHQLGHYHIHGLLDSHGSFQLRRALWAAGKNRHGRCRFEPLRNGEAVQAYVTKYCLKESAAWLMVGD
jgi:hypothetical protein